MTPSRRDKTLAIASCIAAILCFGTVPVMLRHLTAYLDAWTVNAVRYGTAAVFWFPFVLVLGRQFRRRRAADPHVPRRSVWLAAIVPAVPNLLAQIGWATAPYYVEATTIGFVIRTSFLFTVVFGLLFIPAERPLARRPLFLLAAVISVTGVFLMYVERLAAAGFGMGGEAVGLPILLGTAAGYAAYAVCIRKFLQGYPLRLAFGVISLYSTAILIVLMLLFGRYEQLGELAGREWLLLVGSGFVGITFGHIFFHRGIHGVGPVVTNGVIMIGPFYTYLVATIFLDESMTTVQLLGGLTVIAGGFALLKAKAQTDRIEAVPT